MSPCPSKRRRIVEACATRLRAIQVVEGFVTDVGRTLYVGELPTLGEHDPDQVAVLLVGTDVITWQQQKLFVTLPLQVVVLVKTAIGDAWLGVEDVVADVKRAMELEDRMLGGLLDQTKPLTRSSVQPFPREAGSTSVGASIGYSLGFTETWGQP